MYSISDPQVREFLLEGTRTGKLSYTAPDGRPLVAPVWFLLEDDVLVFNTSSPLSRSGIRPDETCSSTFRALAGLDM